MSPDQVALTNAIVATLHVLRGWPLAALLFVLIIGPWLMSVFLVSVQGKRHEAAVRMYESNVKLVDTTQEIARDLKDIIIMNTRTMTEVCDSVREVQLCMMRQGGEGKG
jgi:hypothetical protein